METILGQLLSGLSRAMILFLGTSGLTLLFGVMGVLNMGHFVFYMFGAYFCYTFWSILVSTTGLAYWAAIVLAILSVGALGLIIEFILMRHLYNRILPEVLLATFALIYIAHDVVKMTWGVKYYQVVRPKILEGIAFTAGQPYPNYYLFITIVGFVTAGAIWFMLKKTKFGRIVRACHSYREMVGALGIPVPWVYTAVFVLSAMLASLAGGVWTSIGTASLGMDQAIIMQCFCVMVIGGMGSFLGTLVGALIVGEVYSLTILVMPRLALLLLYLVTGIVLAIRPWGLFGTKGRLH
jgi:branched-chain amino acid transport system permease protein